MESVRNVSSQPRLPAQVPFPRQRLTRRASIADLYTLAAFQTGRASADNPTCPLPPTPGTLPDANGPAHTCADLRARGYQVGEPIDIAADRFPDFTIAVPEHVGDTRRWRIFHVGRDCLSQASRVLKRLVGSNFQEAKSRELIMADCHVDAAIVEKALRGLYGEECKPNNDDVVDLAALLDYWDPANMPNRRWQDVLQACTQLMKTQLDPERAVDLWERAFLLGSQSIQDILAAYIGKDTKALAGTEKLSEKSFAAFLNNPHLSLMEDTYVDTLRAWGERNAPEGTEASAYLAQSSLVPLIRWQKVSEGCLWKCVDADLLTLEEGGEIARVRYQLSQNGFCANSQSLFGAPLRHRREGDQERARREREREPRKQEQWGRRYW